MIKLIVLPKVALMYYISKKKVRETRDSTLFLDWNL